MRILNLEPFCRAHTPGRGSGLNMVGVRRGKKEEKRRGERGGGTGVVNIKVKH